MSKRRGKGEGTFFYSKSRDRWFVAPPGMKQRSAKTRAKALMIFREMMHEESSQVVTDQTVEDFLKWWLQWVKENRAPATYHQYESQVKNYILPHLGHLLLAKLNVGHIDSWIALLRCKPPTKLSVVKTLKAAVSKAHKKQLIVSNPCDAVELPKVKRKEKSVLTPDEVKTILTVTEETRYAALFRLILLIGARQGEMFGLRWKCVNFEDRLITINHQVTESRGVVYEGDPKTQSSIRTIPVSDDKLWDLLNSRRVNALKDRVAGPENYVFLTKENTPIRRGNFRTRVWNKLLEDNGIPHRGMHQCRHTVITELLSSQVSPKTVAGIVGHANPTTTLNVYAQYRSEDAKVALETMSKKIGG